MGDFSQRGFCHRAFFPCRILSWGILHSDFDPILLILIYLDKKVNFSQTLIPVFETMVEVSRNDEKNFFTFQNKEDAHVVVTASDDKDPKVCDLDELLESLKDDTK